MKRTINRILVVSAFFLICSFTGKAQEIGVRLGNVSAGNVAIDGIFSMGEFSRLHGDISFGDGVAADLLWDFFCQPIYDESLNWYMGAGAFLGAYDDDFNIGGAFEIGLEYRFEEVPIAIGLDYRPKLEIIDETKFDWESFGLNIRYVF